MLTTAFKYVAELVDLCAQAGVSKAVLSPGSRNAPIAIALDAHPSIETFTVHDERSAAFMALGLAEGTKSPVIITCTSGSAPLNYASAIAEAYYRNIPLLVLTADRPSYLIEHGDGQTIRQKDVFGNYIKAQFNLPDSNASNVDTASDIIEAAIQSLMNQPGGPVHINLPFAEPLYQIEAFEATKKFILQEPKTEEPDWSQLQKDWSLAEKKMIIVGQMAPDDLLSFEIQRLSSDPSVAILVENTSNLQKFDKYCHCIDRTLAGIKDEEITDFIPDILIHIGDALISKRIKALFRKHKPASVWRLSNATPEMDTFLALTESINTHPVPFLKTLDGNSGLSNFGNKWKQKDFITAEKHQTELSKIPFSDLKAFELILDCIPDDSLLCMANSSVVRYCQLFEPIRSMHYFSNRGVSGIDGSTSTALGLALTTQKLVTLITGDTSFYYDSNALWNNYLPNNLRIIVINNGGGGIFKYIEGPGKSPNPDLFFAPFQSNIADLTKAYNVNYYKASSEDELIQCFYDFFGFHDNQRPAVLEVDTSKIENEKYLINYFKSLNK